MKLVTKVVALVKRVVRREPVAVWGVVVSAVVGVVSGLTGHDVSAIAGVVLPLLGIPVVRRKVSPVDAAKAVIDGADGKLDSAH